MPSIKQDIKLREVAQLRAYELESQVRDWAFEDELYAERIR